MMKQYYVEFWTKSGQRVGLTVSADNGLEAKTYAEKFPDFQTLVYYPKEVR